MNIEEDVMSVKAQISYAELMIAIFDERIEANPWGAKATRESRVKLHKLLDGKMHYVLQLENLKRSR